jgi:protein-arginine deiminase
MRSRSHALVSVLLIALSSACAAGGDDDDDIAGDDDTADDDDAAGGDDDDTNNSTWAFADVFGVPDLDDDDESGLRDFDQAPFAADDDGSVLTLPGALLGALPAGDEVALSLTGEANAVKVWMGNQLVVGGSAGAGPVALAPTAADLDLTVTFGDYNKVATLNVAHVDAAGAAVETAEVVLRSAPLIMNHHLQPAEHVWAMYVGDNAQMIGAYEAALGERFSRVSSGAYGGDVWVQDELEFSTVTGAQDQRMDVVIDSIRDRGLDDFPESELVGPGSIAQTWGNHFNRTSYDSFGNLEASPPVTVDGVSYPYGRVYYGKQGNEGMDSVLPAFLTSQAVQKPFQLDTTFLCVGHVDEISSFVPDASSPKGFKLMLADTRKGWELVESLSTGASIGRYGADHGYPTAGSMLADADLVALNEDVQLDYLDPIKQKFMTELGLTEDDIILVPSLFEQPAGCGGAVAALIPGMVNLIVVNLEGEASTKIFTADPFFRASGADGSADPFLTAFEDSLPAGNEAVFVDDWDVYHLGLGEVHCGTNVIRTPTRGWWNLFSGGQ